MARDAISTLIHLVTVYETPIASGQHQTIIGPLNFHGNNSLKDTFIDLTQNKEMIDECNGVVWNNLYKHELISNIRFPENLLYEDNAFIYPVFTRARSWAKPIRFYIIIEEIYIVLLLVVNYFLMKEF